MKRTNWLFNLIGITLVVILIIFPLYWSIRTSLVPNRFREFFPTGITLDNYVFLFVNGKFLGNILNSVIVSLGSLILTLPMSLLAGYALARFNFPGKRLSIVLFLFPLLPAIAVLIPLILFMRTLGLYNTLFSVILANTVFTLPFAVWMIRGFMLSMPAEIEEAAMIDGATPLQILLQVVIPLSAPGLISVGIFVLISSWNNYLFSFAFTTKPDLQIVPAAILGYISAWGVNYGGMNAAAVVATLPPLIFFLIFQKWFVQGILAGSIK